MMVQKRMVMVMLVFAVAAFAVPALAQDDPAILAEGLNNPRGLFYGSDGTLYIAEAGIAGDIELEGDFGPLLAGETARVVTVSPEGEQTVLVDNLISSEAFDNFIGVNAVHVTEDGTHWLVLGNGPESLQPNTGVLVLDADGAEVRFIDFAAIERDTNPDEDFVVANPIDIAVNADGLVYVLDASANALYTIEGDGEPQLFHVWTSIPVPSAVEVGAEGDVYVSFLSPFPYDPGSAQIERWSPDGELVETYDRFTAIVDFKVDEDGTLYVVEFSRAFGDTGFVPDSGRVLQVTADGETTIADDLNFPYGIAQSPDGQWAVAVNSAFVEPGSGSVILIGGDSAAAAPADSTEAADPAETPEASS